MGESTTYIDVVATSCVYDGVNDCYIYGTGLACETEGHCGVLGMMRSSIYKKGGCYLTNAVGLIDSDQYRGEIKYIYRDRMPLWVRAQHIAFVRWSRLRWWERLFKNLDRLVDETMQVILCNPLEYAPYRVGDICGQLVPLTFDRVEVEEVNELNDTERGDGGFGSTDQIHPVDIQSGDGSDGSDDYNDNSDGS